MAEAVLYPLLKVILENLASPLVDEVRILRGVSKEIEKLSNTLKRIQASINDAEKRQLTEDAVRLWLKELKDVAYDADDIVDEFATKLSHSNTMEEGISFPKNQVCCLSSPSLCFKQITLGNKIVSKIKEIRERLDEIVKDGSQFKLTEGVAEKIGTGEMLETDSYVIESEVYGRDKDRSYIVEMLLHGGSGLEDLSVIPIVGMGGLGKTTLAQLAYNDEQVDQHFEIKIWVCVSDDFDVKRLIKAITEQITKTDCNLSEMNSLQTHLREKLNGRRYLLVLDDVWNEDPEMWDRVKNPLRCGAKGSKIVVTTRSQKVAMIVGTINPYKLEVLSDDDCWSLFEKRAFGEQPVIVDPNLIAIGREIVRKCGGVPLAAKSLGSLMFFKREDNDWLSVRDCEIWKLPEDQNGILPALRMSYTHLPSHLKQCFAYCSIFPKDYRFVKKKLIQQWIAEGFIQSSKGAEDVGNEYFNDLCWRSFFQDIEKDTFGNIGYCKMHDLIHDLAQSVAGDESLILVAAKEKSISKRVRRLSLLYESSEETVPMGLLKANNLRTCLFLFPNYVEFVLPSVALNKMFLSFRCLRVLTLNESFIKKLPTSIGNLIHLRYLDISCTKVEKLPKSISNLRNLQTLKLGYQFRKLPQDMSNFINLRHLGIKKCEFLTHMPAKIGQLSFLQTLPKFIVGKESRCGIEELQSLDLRGDIKIEKLENLIDAFKAKEAKLKDKRNLRTLRLSWSQNESYNGDAIKIENIKEVLESLQPHPNLKRLLLRNYNGVGFSNWLMDSSLPNLTRVWLYNCQRCEFLPPLGQLPFLEILILDKMYSAKCLDLVSYNSTAKGFPSLKTLALSDMPNLEGFSQTDGKDLMPCLKELIINECPKLSSLPRLLSITHLELHNSNTMILRSVSSLISLSLLVIDCFPELKFLPEGMLHDHNLLHSLKISSCPELKSLSGEFENLSSLKKLVIYDCDKLECLPEELCNCIALEHLGIAGCHSLTSLSEVVLQGFTSLQDLAIHNCHKLTCLSSGMRHLTSLKNLTIDELPELGTLPEDLQHHTNLEKLYLGGCDRLTSFPEWLGNLTQLQSLKILNFSHVTSLPTGLQYLSALKFLQIGNCPHLEKLCQNNTREDLPKISHIDVTFARGHLLSETMWLMEVGYSSYNFFDK